MLSADVSSWHCRCCFVDTGKAEGWDDPRFPTVQVSSVGTSYRNVRTQTVSNCLVLSVLAHFPKFALLHMLPADVSSWHCRCCFVDTGKVEGWDDPRFPTVQVGGLVYSCSKVDYKHSATPLLMQNKMGVQTCSNCPVTARVVMCCNSLQCG